MSLEIRDTSLSYLTIDPPAANVEQHILKCLKSAGGVGNFEISMLATFAWVKLQQSLQKPSSFDHAQIYFEENDISITLEPDNKDEDKYIFLTPSTEPRLCKYSCIFHAGSAEYRKKAIDRISLLSREEYLSRLSESGVSANRKLDKNNKVIIPSDLHHFDHKFVQGFFNGTMSPRVTHVESVKTQWENDLKDKKSFQKMYAIGKDGGPIVCFVDKNDNLLSNYGIYIHHVLCPDTKEFKKVGDFVELIIINFIIFGLFLFLK